MMTPEHRKVTVSDLRMFAERERQAQLNKFLCVYEAIKAGMTTREIAAVHGVTSGTISLWSRAGKAEYERRESAGDSGDLEPEG